MIFRTIYATILGQTNYMSEQEKKALHIEDQNMDYAAKEFYGSHKYFNSVLVQVPSEADLGANHTLKPRKPLALLAEEYILPLEKK